MMGLDLVHQKLRTLSLLRPGTNTCDTFADLTAIHWRVLFLLNRRQVTSFVHEALATPHCKNWLTCVAFRHVVDNSTYTIHSGHTESPSMAGLSQALGGDHVSRQYQCTSSPLTMPKVQQACSSSCLVARWLSFSLQESRDVA